MNTCKKRDENVIKTHEQHHHRLQGAIRAPGARLFPLVHLRKVEDTRQERQHTEYQDRKVEGVLDSVEVLSERFK